MKTNGYDKEIPAHISILCKRKHQNVLHTFCYICKLYALNSLLKKG